MLQPLQPRKSRTFVISEPLNFIGDRYAPAFFRIDYVDIVDRNYRLQPRRGGAQLAEEVRSLTFTCTAKTFNECLMEAPCSAWKRSGPKEYKLDTKIIFRGNPLEGETISGGTIGDVLETKCGKK